MNDKLIAPKEVAGNLDKFQLAATEASLGNTCVFAVAGSGKTTLLTHRIANLIHHGVPEREILLLTFTNQAANEMKERVLQVLDKEEVSITSGTFHSVANLFLRQFDYPRKQILDENDSLAMFKKSYDEVVKKEDIPDEAKKALTYKNIFYYYSGSINHHIPLRDYIVINKGPKILDYYGLIKSVIDQYQEDKLKANLRDFDDLLVDIYKLLRDNPVAKKSLTDRYKYIFVDEYQDVNWLQYEFLKQMNVHNNLFVCGDRAQCIYQFRGSQDKYMDTFEIDYPNVQTFFLKNNYRSRPDILKISENAINFNEFKYPVELIPYKEDTNEEIVFLTEEENQYNEASNIAWRIQNEFMLHEYEEIAILVRANYQTRVFEQEFVKRDIPFRLVGVFSFFERAHIKVLISLLQFVDNRKNSVAFDKVARLFPSIGEVTARNLYNALSLDYDFDLYRMLSSYSFKNKNQRYLIEVLAEATETSSVEDVCTTFMDKFYEEYIIKEYDEDHFERLADVKEFIGQAKEDDIFTFLSMIALFKSEQEEQNEENEPKVTVMTIHKAKGKEWDYVFLPGLISYNLPMRSGYIDYVQNTEEVKAERNLFYVACTRAREKLFLSFFKKQIFYSKNMKRETEAKPSPFLREAIKKEKS